MKKEGKTKKPWFWNQSLEKILQETRNDLCSREWPDHVRDAVANLAFEGMSHRPACDDQWTKIIKMYAVVECMEKYGTEAWVSYILDHSARIWIADIVYRHGCSSSSSDSD